MPILFTGKTKQISYDQGKFYIATRLNENAEGFSPTRTTEISLIPPPLLENLEDRDGKKYSFTIVQEFGRPSVYRRHFDDTQNMYIYEQCTNLDGTPTWGPLPGLHPTHARHIADKVAGYFWPPSEYTAIDTSTPRPTHSSLSDGQRSEITQELLVGAGLLGSLETVKTKCGSRSEYDACLQHLIEENTPVPQNATQELLDELNGFKSVLTPQGLQKLPSNIARHYDGHIATAGDVFTYARDFFIAELKKGQPNYQPPPLNLAQDPDWNLLCSPGADITGINLATQTTAKQMLDSLMAVYEPDGTANFELKDPVTREQLTKANEAVDRMRTAFDQLAQAAPPLPPLNVCLKLFIDQIAKNAGNIGSTAFLNTLQQKITARLPTVLLDRPQATQFKALRVDQWAGGPRGATHADFVEFQKRNPNAILLIPDNFKEAALADNRRHDRGLNRGLAIPMKPQIVNNADPANPVYDLCTLGIPTGGPRAGMTLDDQKTEVRKYFKRLYSELRRGREIAAPQLGDNWAFGGGVFPNSELTQFVKDEITKLKNFCEGAAIDAAYQSAWDHPQTAPLPLPQPELAPPPPAPQDNIPGMEADKTLTSAGFRQKFREWLESKNCQLTEEKNEKDKSCLLRGTLPSGVGVIIHKDEMRLDTKGGKPLSDDEFRKSFGELIDLYKSAYHPGQIPPVKLIDIRSDARKAIAEELLAQKGVPMVAKPAAAPTADSPAPEGAAPPPRP